MTTNEELQQRKDKVVARGFSNLIPVFADHARNAEIRDVEPVPGETFLTFLVFDTLIVNRNRNRARHLFG
jgi:hypothetical protein